MTRLDCGVCRRMLIALHGRIGGWTALIRPTRSLRLLEPALNHELSFGALFDSTELLLRNLVAVLRPITTHSYAPTAPAAVRIAMLRRYGSQRAPVATIPAGAAA